MNAYKISDLLSPGVYAIYNEKTNEVYVGESTQLGRRTLRSHIHDLLFKKHINPGLQSMFDDGQDDLMLALFPASSATKKELREAEALKSMEYARAGWTVHNAYHESSGKEQSRAEKVYKYSFPKYQRAQDVPRGCPYCRTAAPTFANIGTVRQRLILEYEQAGGYRPVAMQYGVSAAMIWKILNEGYIPGKAETGKKMGYTPGCPNCGYEFGEE